MGLWTRLLFGAMGVGGLGVTAISAAVGYAAATADGRLRFPDTPYPAITASTDPEVIAQGRYLVHATAHCSSCHSTDDRDAPAKVKTAPLTGGLPFAMGPMGTRYAVNLTPDPETGIGARTDAELARAIRTGVLHDGELSFFMRFSVANLSDEDLTAVISYLRSLEPVRNEVPRGEWYLLGKILLTFAFPPLTPKHVVPTHVPPSDEPSVARGEYLADHVMLCTSCHTGFDMATFEPTGPKAGGGTPEASHGSDHDMEYAPPNLTAHPTGITGQLDEDAFVARLHGGRKYVTSIMPWENLESVTDADLRSVYRYLRTLPPVDNDTGPSYRKVGWTPDGG